MSSAISFIIHSLSRHLTSRRHAIWDLLRTDESTQKKPLLTRKIMMTIMVLYRVIDAAVLVTAAIFMLIQWAAMNDFISTLTLNFHDVAFGFMCIRRDRILPPVFNEQTTFSLRPALNKKKFFFASLWRARTSRCHLQVVRSSFGLTKRFTSDFSKINFTSKLNCEAFFR